VRQSGKILGLVLSVAVLWIVAQAPARAASGEWTTNYKEALAKAAETDKKVLAWFTGSDWCGWCTKLDNEVFKKAAFKAWANKNVVLLELDFPKRKRLPAELKQQNNALRNKHGIRGYPTVIILDSQERVMAKLGYMRGGPKAWTRAADKMIAFGEKIIAYETIRLASDPAAALASAKQKKKPLLVALGATEAAEGENPIDAVLGDPDFATFSNYWMVAVRPAPTAKVGTVPAGDDGGLKAQLSKHGVEQGKGRFVVLDVVNDTVLLKVDMPVTASDLRVRISKALPKVAYEGGWVNDAEKAKVIAAQQDKPMIVDYTGSDWCSWCVKLDKEIFAKTAFRDFAVEKLVLLKLDFPRRKKLPVHEQVQNQALMNRFGVSGLPTLLIFDSTWKKIGKMGYVRGGATPFLTQLKGIVKS